MAKCPAKHHPTPPSAFTWRKLTPPKRVTRHGWPGNPPRWGTPPLMWKQSRKNERLYGDIGNPTKAGDLTYLVSPTSMWTGPNTHTTTRELRRICCSGTKPELMLLERLVAWELNVEWEHLFRTILKWFRQKNNLRGVRKTQRETAKQAAVLPDNISLLVFTLWRFTRKTEYSLTLDNFSLSSQHLVPNYCLYPSKGSDVHGPILTK